MSSSTNSGKPRLSQRKVTKVHERYGLKFTLHVIEETRQDWQQVIRDSEGNVIEEGVPPDPSKHSVSWEATADTVTSSYVEQVHVQDQEDCETQKPVLVYSTPDGPILGIQLERHSDHLVLLDPCVIQYSATGTIRFLPIFNVSRRMILYKSAVRAITPPAEVLVSAYPGFIIQNRTFKYQLKPIISLAETPPLDNAATAAVEIKA